MNGKYRRQVDNGPMLNAYPDSIGNNLQDTVRFLEDKSVRGAFQSFYILPSIFNSDIDRGFSIIDYGINEVFGNGHDLEKIRSLGIDLKLDFVLNHLSVLSKQFQDMIDKGEASEYCDFFIDWNKFWENHGNMTERGYIQPDPQYIQNMFFRKAGLPILMIRRPDGKDVPYWNTFYQKVEYGKVDAQELVKKLGIQYMAAVEIARIVNEGIEAGKTPEQLDFTQFAKYKDNVISYLEINKKYWGQMDLNIKSPLVWSFYEDTLKKLAAYGAKIVRLDAFAYASKEIGQKNFFNEPETWDLLEKLDQIAKKHNLNFLPEIHASYEEKKYEYTSKRGYMVYDFFLPGLVIDALERKKGDVLKSWADELISQKIRCVNMLGCHDGIPLLDLRGLLPEEQIQKLIDIIKSRGGLIKNLHGKKDIYYQINSTYYSALGASDEKMLLARAIQLFMPGKPQIWYLDLFAGENNYEAVKQYGDSGHKEINRTNLSLEEVFEKCGQNVVKKQIEMLQFRNTFPAFGFDSDFSFEESDSCISIRWEKEGYVAKLDADLAQCTFQITGMNEQNEIVSIV